MRNRVVEETLSEALSRLRLLLPPSWSVEVAAGSQGRADATVTLKGPESAAALLDVAVKRWTTAPTANVTGVLAGVQRMTSQPVLLVTDYTNSPLRKACEDLGISYLDEAGWAFIKIDDPPIFIRTEGTDRPAPRVASEVTRLNGIAVGRIIRTLLDISPPVGVRDLGKLAGVKSAGVVSKLLPTLVSAGAVVRDERARIVDVRRRALLHRWTQDYSYLNGNGLVLDYLAPRGLGPVVEQLADLSGVCVTGAVAGRAYLNKETVPVVPVTTLSLYANNPRRLGDQLGVLIDRQSSNVVIAAPRDPELVALPARSDSDLPLAPLPQVLADLLTLPGRESLLADQLMDQLAESDPRWCLSVPPMTTDADLALGESQSGHAPRTDQRDR